MDGYANDTSGTYVVLTNINIFFIKIYLYISFFLSFCLFLCVGQNDRELK